MISYIEKYKKIGQTIKTLRKERKITQEQLADKVGISVSYLSKIEAENCHKSISLEVLFAIAEALEVDIKTFF